MCATEAANVSESAAIDFNTDAAFLLPSAAETMLRELENPPAEFKSLSDLFLRLSDVSCKHRNCSAGTVGCDADREVRAGDVCTSEIRRKRQKQKCGHNHLSDAQARITKLRELKENSRKLVSMFIPPDAPKLSFTDDVIGVYGNYL